MVFKIYFIKYRKCIMPYRDSIIIGLLIILNLILGVYLIFAIVADKQSEVHVNIQQQVDIASAVICQKDTKGTYVKKLFS